MTQQLRADLEMRRPGRREADAEPDFPVLHDERHDAASSKKRQVVGGRQPPLVRPAVWDHGRVDGPTTAVDGLQTIAFPPDTGWARRLGDDTVRRGA